MISSDIKIAARTIVRNKIQSVISILGLGIGLGCIILLLGLILHETSFNKFIPGHESVYRIVFGQSGATQYPLAEKMKEDFENLSKIKWGKFTDNFIGIITCKVEHRH